MQPWSGNTWGWQHLPRVGTEVAMSFMNGDPDAPVVVGCFYNEDMRPVFPIPEQQTRQGFRSRSTLRGTTQEFSELSFDDRKGSELVFLHAQKDHTTEVEHDQSLSVEHDRTVSIGNDETKTIGRNYSLTTKTGSVEITAATSITLRVGANTITINETGIQMNCTTFNLAAKAVASIEAVGDMNISTLAAATFESTGIMNIEGSEVSIEALDGAVICAPFPV